MKVVIFIVPILGWRNQGLNSPFQTFYGMRYWLWATYQDPVARLAWWAKEETGINNALWSPSQPQKTRSRESRAHLDGAVGWDGEQAIGLEEGLIEKRRTWPRSRRVFVVSGSCGGWSPWGHVGLESSLCCLPSVHPGVLWDDPRWVCGVTISLICTRISYRLEVALLLAQCWRWGWSECLVQADIAFIFPF